MFACDDHIDVVPAAQAMIENREETVGVGRQIAAHDIGLLVDDVIQKTGVLMGEPVMVLLPDVRSQQVVQ